MSQCIVCDATDVEGGTPAVRIVNELNETVCNYCWAEELRERTSLKKREAEVEALKQFGFSHQEIADELGIAKSTVDEYSRRINDRVRRAHGTIEFVEE